MLLHVIFWTSLAALFFTYAGYPLLLCLVAPLRRTPVIRPESFEPSLSLLIPARNEAAQIEAKLRNCVQLDYPKGLLEILLINDGSDDDTVKRAQDFARQNGWFCPGDTLAGERPDNTILFRIITVTARLGKSFALGQGAAVAQGEILVFSDADSLIAMHSLRLLVHPFVNPIVGCTAGRYVPGGHGPRPTAGVGLYWRYENHLREMESRVGGLLGASGALYAVRRNLFEPLEPGLINDDFIIPMRITAKGYRSLFVPGATAQEEASRSADHEFSRRVRIMAGNCEHLWLFRGLLWDWRRWRTAVQLFCHKFLRVISPLWLIVALVCNGFLLFQGNALFLQCVYLIIFLMQLGCYALAGIGTHMKRLKGYARVLALPYYFALINLAALCGVYYFFFNRKGLVWRSPVADEKECPR
ncbi:TPA: hypothetical protein DDW35_13370 [Candidatus Sumerlaeota bacterium]|jgi:cellulose synthase/poly-beta-1,6-N-acetylglucosamine synthase-like glycosyltransferase|nr:hypothetical protein [Candidatus Sumerlaeota bacterium]